MLVILSGYVAEFGGNCEKFTTPKGREPTAAESALSEKTLLPEGWLPVESNHSKRESAAIVSGRTAVEQAIVIPDK
jgi:hypothetical protein